MARRVRVLGLGGTIAMTAGGAGAVVELSPAQLLEAVPGLAATGITVAAEPVRAVPGAAVDFPDLYALAARIERHLAPADGVDGVVVTQGTDTIEESAYLLDLLHAAPAPVVVTGAMRNPSLAGADGPANLLAAVQVAASEAARGRGVLVVLADEIHAASRVRKLHTTSVAAFGSPTGGPLGYVVEGQPRFLNRPEHRYLAPRHGPGRFPRVGLATVSMGEDGALVAALAERVDGLVVAGFGAGHVPAPMVPALAGLAGAMPVVLASRTGAGSLLSGTYGFPGSERDLLGRGLISAGRLDPLKSRVLLTVLLAAGADRATIRGAFATAGGAPA